MIITDENGVTNNLQISRLADVPELAEGLRFNPKRPCLLKNVSGSDIEDVYIKLQGQSTPIKTTLFVGWNPEICDAIIGPVSAGLLQYGN